MNHAWRRGKAAVAPTVVEQLQFHADRLAPRERRELPGVVMPRAELITPGTPRPPLSTTTTARQRRASLSLPGVGVNVPGVLAQAGGGDGLAGAAARGLGVAPGRMLR